MKMNNNIKKRFAIAIIILFIGLTITPGIVHTLADAGESQISNETITFFQEFSHPLIEDDEEYISVKVKEADSWTVKAGEPKIPVFTKTFEFQWGTKITDIECRLSDVKTMSISKRVKAVPSFQRLESSEVISKNEINPAIYNSNEAYPSDWFSYNKGVGINKNGDRVLFLSIHVCPTRYIPLDNVIEHIDDIQLSVHYEESEITVTGSNVYDLVIIAPSEFSDSLMPLVNHKINHSVKTNLTTLEHINDTFDGRDTAEKMKYFVKYAIEEWGISYVLLVGDVNKLPIRTAYSIPWEEDLLTDLYYADIYNETYDFCSWDANDNNLFGEVTFDDGFPPKMNNIDQVDLYPDVYIGRLPCTTEDEVDVVVDKIITYEEDTFDQIWFKKIILAGGDTFPPDRLRDFFIYEGEITNTKVAQELPDFEHIKLWATKRNLNAVTFHRELSKGAGFVTYAGHGVPNGFVTYRPNAIGKLRRQLRLYYFTPLVDYLKNQYKLPIMFFDACLTAKLDNNFSDYYSKFPWYVRIQNQFNNLIYDPSALYPCFAWSFVRKEGGGAIATIGATRVAFTWVDKDGVYGGAGYLDVHLFKAYEEGVTLGQMFVQSQNDYINNVYKDYFTIEEFILIGDPSLMVGGYP